jgi:hypothetical protein
MFATPGSMSRSRQPETPKYDVFPDTPITPMGALGDTRTPKSIATPRPDFARPSVYVKPRDAAHVPAKKVLLPATLRNLLRVCRKVLCDGVTKPEILCVLNDRGFVIERIDDVKPGATLFASTIDPEFELHDPETSARQANVISKPKPDSPQPTKLPVLPTAALIKQKTVTPRVSIDLRQLGRKQLSSDSDDSTSPVTYGSQKFTGFLQKVRGSSDDDDAETKRQQEERRKKLEFVKSCVVIEDQANFPFQKMLEEIVPPPDGPKNLECGLQKISKDRRKFIQDLSQLEGEQIFIWIKSAADQPFLKRHPQQWYQDPVTQVAKNFFERHRFHLSKSVSYRFMGAIVGPPLSGKSTLLGHCLDQFLLELTASGLWKSTFVLAMDVKVLVAFFGDVVTFYQKFTDHVLDACLKQKPLIKPDAANIRRQLRSVTEMRLPLTGLHDYHDVDRIARELNLAWRDNGAFDVFMMHVFMLPVSLPRAFGFTSVALFVDNIEHADVSIPAQYPFRTDQGYVFAVENLKIALRQANFIVSCQSVAALFAVLGPLEESSVDLRPGLDVVTLYEATTDLGSRLRYDFMLELQRDNAPVRVSVAMCGGIPTFLAAWDELNHTLFQLERTNKDDPKWQEIYYQAINDGQRLVDLLFISQTKERVIVVGVSREYHDERDSVSGAETE